MQWRKIRLRRVLLRLFQAVVAVQGTTLLALAVLLLVLMSLPTVRRLYAKAGAEQV